MDTAQAKWCKTPPDLVPCQAPYLDTEQVFYGMYGVELNCINLGESDAFVGDEAF